MRCSDCVRNAPNNFGEGWCLLLRRRVDGGWFCADFAEKGDGPERLADKLRRAAASASADEFMRCDLANEFGLRCSDARDCADCMARTLRRIADMADGGACDA